MENHDFDEQLRIITKGAAEIVLLDELRNKLIRASDEKRPLVVKLGHDPTDDIYHFKPLRFKPLHFKAIEY